MKRRIKLLMWVPIGILFSILFLPPVLYFFAHVSKPNFVDSTMGNWFATMVGVFAGIPIGLEINRFQRESQEKARADEKLEKDQQQLKLILGRVESELLDNREQVENLQHILQLSESARSDHWAWAITVVDAFSFSANASLIDAGLQRLLPRELEGNLYDSYKGLSALSHKVRQAAAALHFFYGSSGDATRANQGLNEIRAFSQDVQHRLNNTLEELRNHKQPTRKPLNRIGILAYGSLIDEPCQEIKSVTIDRRTIETPFSIEFARYSRTRNGAPTLVPVEEGGGKVNAVVLVLDESVSECQASDMLWRRETNQVGSEKIYTRPTSPGSNHVLIERLSGFADLDVVLYTDFAPTGKISNPTPYELATKAIESAKAAAGSRGQDGISYLIRAKKNGAITPLVPEYEAEILCQTDTPTLEKALLNIRSHVQKETQ